MKKLILSLALMCLAAAAPALTPQWLRYAKISPDGTQIAFCYKGDIWKVAAKGGQATRLTSQASYEKSPVWSPDGTQIAFASDRHGNFDVFVMSSDGGTAARLTTHSAAEVPQTFSPDGKQVYYTASIQKPVESAFFPRYVEVYRVSAAGGRSEQVLGTPAEDLCFNRQGTLMLYHDKKGGENEFRKHHTSSITRDVWLYDTKTGRHTNLTARGGEDRNPVFSPDESTVYFLSERGGSQNVYRMPLNDPKQVSAVTTFTANPVRYLSIARDGTLCFAYDGDLYTQRPGAACAKVPVEAVTDDEPLADTKPVTPSGAVASPDGKQLAFVCRGDVFVTSVEYNTTKQITHTAAAEKGVTWADNRTIAYASERNGNWQLVTATIARTQEPDFAGATVITEKVLLPSATVERVSPQYSPDGKELAFIEDRCRLKVLNLATGKVRQVTDGTQWVQRASVPAYHWSPDGKWFSIAFFDTYRYPLASCGLVSAQGGKIYNFSNTGYRSNLGQWALGGNAILFYCDRYGMRSHSSRGNSLTDVVMVFLNRATYDKYKLNKEDYDLLKEDGKKAGTQAPAKAVEVELDGMSDRIRRLTPSSSDLYDACVSSDGETLYYISEADGSTDLCKVPLRGGSKKVMQKGIGSGSLQLSADGKTLFFCGTGSAKTVAVASGEAKAIPVKATMQVDCAAEREAMFRHIVLQEQKAFYDAKLHGVDWQGYAKTYAKFLPHINNNYDFADLCSELLGELNVSHTGCRYRGSGAPGDATGSLGLLYDLGYTGPGLRVAEVVAEGPLDRVSSRVRKGCVIEAINGNAFAPGADEAAILNGIAGKRTLITVSDPATGERWDEVVRPVTQSAMETLLYERWVRRRAADVERLSGGRLGYVHVKAMNDASFRKFYHEALGKYNDKEGIIVDTRYNGGGTLHEDIANFFGGWQQYATQVVRGNKKVGAPARHWTRPSCMLIGEANYSNAHGTPWLYKHLNIGKLVGMPVQGTMTTVSWETLQDRTLYFGIPIVGFQIADGSYLEGQQLEPDVLVANNPETVSKGEDLQLKAAVSTLLKEIDATK